jgi:ATP-dependent helicase/nuclease subunit B
VSIVGVCDRIDAMEKDGRNYIRIVDYKTGTKKFSLEDVYNGLSSQLLLYMNSVTNSKEFVENPVPAAVMYQPSDAAFRFDDDSNLYTPVGMAVNSRTVSQGFDKDCSGEFGVIQGDEKIKNVTGSEIVDEKLFAAVMEHSKEKIKEMAQAVYDGQFDNLPMDLGGEKTSCEWCGYRPICQEFDRIKPRCKADFRVKEDNADG